MLRKIDSVEFVRSAHTEDDFVRDRRPEVAFVGRSNVGKSSLLNRLLRRQGLARTSSTPGRTRSVNYFLVNDACYFVDLPGYGYAKTSKEKRERWASLMDRYFDTALPDAATVLIVDGKIGGTHLDTEAIQYLLEKGSEPIVVATKIDKVKRGQRRDAVQAVRDRLGLPDGYPVLEFSATSGEGVGELRGEIGRRLSETTSH